MFSGFGPPPAGSRHKSFRGNRFLARPRGCCRLWACTPSNRDLGLESVSKLLAPLILGSGRRRDFSHPNYVHQGL